MISTNNKIPFLDGYKISISDIPKYDHFTCGFVEKLDVALLKIIYVSDKLKEKPEIKSQLKNIIDAIDKKGYLKVKHYQAKKCGRFYADKNISIIPLSKYVKHSIFHYLGWIDLDWIKGHPSIAMEVAKSVGGLLPMFTRYANDFDNIVKIISDYYSLDPNDPLTKENIKWLFNSMIYGGGFDSWVRGVTEGDETYSPKKLKNTNHVHSLILDFKGECKYVIDRIYCENPGLAKKVCDPNDELYQKKNTTASYWFQIIENHVIHIIADFLLERGIIKNGEFGCEYDGLNIPPCVIPDKDLLVNEINDLVKLRTGMDFKFKFKEYDENYILHECIEERKMLVVNEEEEEVEEDEESKQYKKFLMMAEDFEKNHAKIINKSVFVKQGENENIIKSENQMIISYKHLNYGSVKKTKSFITKWLTCNNDIRRYDDMEIYPNPKLCPPNVFNMWVPFKCETYTGEYEKNEEALNFILNHIKVLCNYETEVYDYVIFWIAQMIQYPEVKTVIITMISKQGAGKGTFMKLLTLMLGEKKVLETTDPSRDVWGNFNGAMANAFLVNLNELSKKETMEAEGKIKGLVTDAALTINNKGVNQFSIQSYHRFLITTNKEDGGMKTTNDDRRNLIVRCSDDKIGDKEYFKQLNEYLNDKNMIRTCYDYFKSIPNMDKFGTIEIPKTEYQNNLKELTKTPIEMWLEDFTRKHFNEESVEMIGKDTYTDFNTWKIANNITYDTNPLKLGVSLSNLQIKNAITKGRHTMKGDTKYFNVPILKKHFGLGLLIDLNNDNNNNNCDDNTSEVEYIFEEI